MIFCAGTLLTRRWRVLEDESRCDKLSRGSQPSLFISTTLDACICSNSVEHEMPSSAFEAICKQNSNLPYKSFIVPAPRPQFCNCQSRSSSASVNDEFQATPLETLKAFQTPMVFLSCSSLCACFSQSMLGQRENQLLHNTESPRHLLCCVHSSRHRFEYRSAPAV